MISTLSKSLTIKFHVLKKIQWACSSQRKKSIVTDIFPTVLCVMQIHVGKKNKEMLKFCQL